MIDLETYRKRIGFSPILQSVMVDKKKKKHYQLHLTRHKNQKQKKTKTAPMSTNHAQFSADSQSFCPESMGPNNIAPIVKTLNDVIFNLLFWIVSIQTLCTLLIISGIEVNPGPMFGEQYTHKTVLVVGHCHQANITLTKHAVIGCSCIPYSYTQGVQCVTNSLCAVTFTTLKDITTWQPCDMDTILCSGDKLYKSISSVPRYLEMADLPSVINVFQKTFSVTQLPSSVTSVLAATIRPALDAFSRGPSSYAILFLGSTSGAYSSSLHFHKQHYFIFDPHARSPETGYPHPDGKSVVIQFEESTSCALYIKNLAQHLHAKQLNICPIQLKEIQVCTEKTIKFLKV